MRKIPTVFVRDWDGDRRYVTREPHPDCGWVFEGEGTATRKYDGTCVMYDGEQWWARREVKKGKADPPNFLPIEEDDTTGKRMGWEPIEQSGWAKFHAEALADEFGIVDRYGAKPEAGATYELVGPRINGNPEQVKSHLLVRHGYEAAVDGVELDSLPLDFDGLAAWLSNHPYEGLVWHHPDGRMAKLKKKDMPAAEDEPEQEETVPDLPQVRIGGMVFSAEWSDDKPGQS